MSLLFVTGYGHPLINDSEASHSDLLCTHFRRLMRNCCLHRDQLSFYSLRRTFRTVADGARDSVAIDLIMGHSDPSMGAVYRQRIDDVRLVAVAEFVRAWVFAAPSPEVKNGTEAPQTATATVTGQSEGGEIDLRRIRSAGRRLACDDLAVPKLGCGSPEMAWMIPNVVAIGSLFA